MATEMSQKDEQISDFFSLFKKDIFGRKIDPGVSFCKQNASGFRPTKSFDEVEQNSNVVGMVIDDGENYTPVKNLLKYETFPVHPEMENLADRVTSFKLWPKQMSQSPIDLAQAGFYYNNKADFTTCFWCGGIVHKWLANEDPVFEHKKHFGHCKFLKMISM